VFDPALSAARSAEMSYEDMIVTFGTAVRTILSETSHKRAAESVSRKEKKR
jgi:hypothetical protein